MLAQPSMRTGVGNTPVADSEPQVEEENHLPEIVASNLSPEDTLIGIKPLTRRNIQILSDSSAVDMPDVDSLSVGMIDVDSLGNDTVSQEISDKSAISADSIDDDRDDFTRINREKVDIETAVAFSAKDSVVLLGNNLAYLFGEGKVEYGQFKLDADEIKMVMDSTTVYATGRVDSRGELIGKPVFQDGGDTYESKSMSFNF
ncbi:MAG: hypothetical protein K2O47_04550, partial [Muribaculaceae bacterium]|nr:hypothetical protein [Muribaculaceae bacterium]